MAARNSPLPPRVVAAPLVLAGTVTGALAVARHAWLLRRRDAESVYRSFAFASFAPLPPDPAFRAVVLQMARCWIERSEAVPDPIQSKLWILGSAGPRHRDAWARPKRIAKLPRPWSRRMNVRSSMPCG
jgi:hypothetical protein